LDRRDFIRLFAAGIANLSAGRAAAAWPVAPLAQQSSPSSPPLLPLFPLPLVLFPEADLVLHIFEERYKQMVRDCLLNRWEFGILLAQPDKIETVGCTAGITEILRSYRNGEADILVQGRRRFNLTKTNREKSYLRGEVEFFQDDENDQPVDLLQRQAGELMDRLAALMREKEPAFELPEFSSGKHLSYQIMAVVPADLAARQRLLALRSEHGRLVQVNLHLQQVIEILEKGPGAAAPKSRA
jgi:Lon protease-like protein